MYDQRADRTGKDRSQTIVLVSVTAVILIIGLIALLALLGDNPSDTGMARPGSAEFDSYSKQVKISDLDKRVGERLNNRYARLIFSVHNSGDKTLEGLELQGSAIGVGGDVLGRKTMSPIPEQASELGPDRSITVDLYIEPIPDFSEIKDFRVDVTGLDVND